MEYNIGLLNVKYILNNNGIVLLEETKCVTCCESCAEDLCGRAGVSQRNPLKFFAH